MQGMKGTATRALVVAVVTAGLLGWLHALGVGLRLLLALALLISFVTLVVPWLGVRWLDDFIAWLEHDADGHGFGLDISDA